MSTFENEYYCSLLFINYNMTCIVYCVSDTKIRLNIIFSKRHGKFNIYYIFNIYIYIEYFNIF